VWWRGKRRLQIGGEKKLRFEGKKGVKKGLKKRGEGPTKK